VIKIRKLISGCKLFEPESDQCLVYRRFRERGRRCDPGSLGQGFRLVLARGLTPGHVTYDEGLAIVAHDPDPAALRGQILRTIARAALKRERLPATERNIARLAARLGRPGPSVMLCRAKQRRRKPV
jgi:hypothetical protein